MALARTWSYCSELRVSKSSTTETPFGCAQARLRRGGIKGHTNQSQVFLRVFASLRLRGEKELLLHHDIGDLDVGILTIPLGGNAFEGQAEGRALAGG